MIDWFERATSDPSLVVLEGFHAVKHAHRFGAEIVAVISSHDRALRELAAEVAPDMSEVVNNALAIPSETFSSLFRHPHPTGLAAVARRPIPIHPAAMARSAPIVLLDDPRHLGNIGAAVRICAAGGASGIITVGAVDPWHPAAIRGSAGLHFALPTIQVAGLPTFDRPIIAFDPEGEDGRGFIPPDDAVLAFGSERTGLSTTTKRAADRLISFPMRPDVSSVNLAASVGIGLYMWRLNTAPSWEGLG
ncbi:MAG: TrmH family RNA methyltransferase [Acidimicrobiia bacterium]|nr:TrmH family RNA methyltransferase [Acidimicrobiia bacterium]MDH5422148.1 TrmH family RNA methyltransferase [Acidimicrobiia bacterium]MDH5503242.1 TrmH family RNA methyltransferase [Acidimicrobiia bacterium]